jgi:hypothetical protein
VTRAPASAALVVGLVQALAQAPVATLTGFARLPADTFAAGPASGAFRAPGATAFRGQPVQGFSSIRPLPGDRDGWFLALADNGYGARVNSRDFLLRLYRVRPHWPRSRQGSVGRVDVADDFIQLSDPLHKVPFPIVNDRSADRLLTGADFDPESFVLDEDGTFWIGDEFGPFILHADATGRLIDAPFEAPGIRSPDHPALTDPGAATVERSRGFEGLAGRDGSDVLYAALEGGVRGDPANTTRILEFNCAERRFTGTRFQYAFEADGHSLTELIVVSWSGQVRGADEPLHLLAIERDNLQGDQARFKRVFEVHLRSESHDAPAGDTIKREVLDLLSILNPSRLGEFGTRFSFPFITPEALWAVGPDTLVLVNDNNYPGTGGRGKDVKDATEFIRVRVVQPLAVE